MKEFSTLITLLKNQGNLLCSTWEVPYRNFLNSILQKHFQVSETKDSLSFSETFAAMMDTSASLAICRTFPSLDEVEGGLFLKSGSAWVVCFWFYLLAIVRVSGRF